MSDSKSLLWLQEIESALQSSLAMLSVQYDDASGAEKPKIYMALARLQERQKTVKSALIDVLQKRIRIEPPSQEMINKTTRLTDELQDTIQAGKKYSAVLNLLSDLSDLVKHVIVGHADA